MSSTNWSDIFEEGAKSGVGQPLPAADYPVRVETAEFTLTSNEKKMWKVKFEVTAGASAGRKIWNNFVLSPESAAALSFFTQHMTALGLTKEYFAQNPTDEQVADALVGREAVVTLIQKPRPDGAPGNEVKAVKPAGTPVAPSVPAPTAAPAAPAPPVPAPAPAAPAAPAVPTAEAPPVPPTPSF